MFLTEDAWQDKRGEVPDGGDALAIGGGIVTRIRRAIRSGLVVITLGVSFLTLRCSQMNPTATSEEVTIVMTASPSRVPAGGVSEITAIGTKKSGAPIWDGVTISFSTDIGSVEPSQAEFKSGQAHVTYHAPSTIGEATIRAVSGSVPITDISISVAVDTSTLLLSADRTSLPYGGGRVVLRAVAYDDRSNPVKGAPVVFATTRGTLASGGRQLLTSSAGLAKDVLLTDADSTVTARSGDVPSESVSIAVDDAPVNIAPVAQFVWSPASPLVGQTVFFNGSLSTDEDGRVVQWQWDFGDGFTATGKKTTHTYAAAGTYTVVLCVTDDDGAQGCASDNTVEVTEEE
ncbi:MAG: PKD domain-containing protein [Acidobacteria bacterium]|nr:PKD domain-containing protein [Acidobacteriota bacterium]